MANIFSSAWNAISRGASKLWDFAKPLVGGVLGVPSGGNLLTGLGQAIGSAVGPLIQAGSSWMAGDRARDDQAAQTASQQAANLAAQREFAQNGIRWKVEDAKAAGLHPLSALGASGAAFAPNPVVLSDTSHYAATGQNLGRAASAMVSQEERATRQLQLAAAAASVRKDNALSAFYESEAARTRQQSGPTTGTIMRDGMRPGDIMEPSGAVIRPLGPRGDIDVSPQFTSNGIFPQTYPPKDVPVTSHTKGENPMWSTYVAEGGLKIDLPSSAASEGLEAVSESYPVMAFVIQQNMRRYGASWLSRAIKVNPEIFGPFRHFMQ